MCKEERKGNKDNWKKGEKGMTTNIEIAEGIFGGGGIKCNNSSLRPPLPPRPCIILTSFFFSLSPHLPPSLLHSTSSTPSQNRSSVNQVLPPSIILVQILKVSVFKSGLDSQS